MILIRFSTRRMLATEMPRQKLLYESFYLGSKITLVKILSLISMDLMYNHSIFMHCASGKSVTISLRTFQLNIFSNNDHVNNTCS